MKAFPLQDRSLRGRRRNAMRAGMAIAIAATTACAVIAPNAVAAGDDSATSTSASSSRSTTGTKIRDATITTKAKAELVGTNGLSSGDIHVKTQRGVVTLTGSVPEEQQRTQAVSVVKQVDGVQDVRDQLTIRAK
ncbi:BON domain-containing protein [Burkholderia sp. Ac-20344]|uniref:BON domain-containing protein n=1 Tax=Burkholderia sp. Ac-20344 TaxID=2703890 RepID=UPI00197C65CD|nr:BON domain-containing protein [Burkholderia sp. Ac-20344]MBN3831871.1 BON domain-containing protein [Burkholderia sp. Ac-20344]